MRERRCSLARAAPPSVAKEEEIARCVTIRAISIWILIWPSPRAARCVGDLHNYWGADATLALTISAERVSWLLRQRRRRPPKKSAAGGPALLGVSHCGGVTAAARSQRPRLLMAAAPHRARVSPVALFPAFRREKSAARAKIYHDDDEPLRAVCVKRMRAAAGRGAL